MLNLLLFILLIGWRTDRERTSTEIHLELLILLLPMVLTVDFKLIVIGRGALHRWYVFVIVVIIRNLVIVHVNLI